MDNLLIPGVPEGKTPTVDFKVTGELLIEGRSVSENPVLFYEPAMNWLKEFKETNPATMTLTMKVEYFNTASSKMFFYIFKAVEAVFKEGCEVKVIWMYDNADEDMLESGKDYQSICAVPFKYIEMQ